MAEYAHSVTWHNCQNAIVKSVDGHSTPPEIINCTFNSTTANTSTPPLLGVGSLPSRPATAVAAVIMLIFSVEALLGNFWISVVIIRDKRLWNAINIFIVSMCINDLLNMFLTQSFVIQSYITITWLSGDVVCRFLPEFSILFSGCSLWHSALIAIHRYLVIVKNDFYRNMSQKLYVITVLIVTRVIPFCAVVPALLVPMATYVPKLLRCIISSQYVMRTLGAVSVIIIVPCIVVIVCYITIFAYVHRIRRQMQSINASIRHEILITKMFGVTFLLFVVGYMIYGLVRIGDRDNTYDADVYVFVSVLHHIGTCLNPLIYGLMNRQIRNACMASIKDKLCRDNKQAEIEMRTGYQSVNLKTENCCPNADGNSCVCPTVYKDNVNGKTDFTGA